MSIAPSPDAARSMLVLLAVVSLASSGCSTLVTSGFKMVGTGNQPVSSAAGPESNYVPVGGIGTLPSGTFTQEVYQSVRKAKANNSIVLQVLDDEIPIRVLPLPSPDSGGGIGAGIGAGGGAGSAVGGRTVFVSTLLTQTGVMQKLGRAQAALYRPSPANYEGIRMDVLFSEAAPEQVRPESDYALRPGDRIVIRKDDRMGMTNIIDMVLKR